MMFGHELIEALHFLRPYWPDGQKDQNLLFIGRGLAKTSGLFLIHARQGKKIRPGCPAKSFNPFFARALPLPKNAP
jgi:hypothetical protein